MEQTNEVIQKITNKITIHNVLFFDLDGTLINTNISNFLSYQKAIKSVTKLELDLVFNFDKRFNRSNLKDLIPNLSETVYQRIIQEKEKYYSDFLPETTLVEEIADILFKYSNTNKTVLVTNCRKDRAISTLKHHNLIDNFSDIFYRQISKNEKRMNKYENALNCLKLSAQNVIVFENEKTEIDDAVLAGIPLDNIISL